MGKLSKFALSFLAIALSASAFMVVAADRPARADISLSSPIIQALQARMDSRFEDLRVHFDLGALGFTSDGLVEVRDASKIPLSQRVPVSTLVLDDNRDRRAVYREIAVANGHPEWEGQIRETFASQWIASARPRWWYQDASGTWKQK